MPVRRGDTALWTEPIGNTQVRCVLVDIYPSDPSTNRATLVRAVYNGRPIYDEPVNFAAAVPDEPMQAGSIVSRSGNRFFVRCIVETEAGPWFEIGANPEHTTHGRFYRWLEVTAL